MKIIENTRILSRLAYSATFDRMDWIRLRIRHGLFAACLGWAAFAFAQTPISGSLTESAHWTPENGPYILSGPVVVDNGAVLDIDAGVDIYMAAQASLTVLSGTIRAKGTPTGVIRVLSDKTRQGQTPAPGDWEQWVFESGTVNTQLDHVLFQNGKGLAVHGASPIFNHLDLRHHAGPAITIDLAASPSGIGNQAIGNTLNGILVPPGEISGLVKWGLKGIPYVVTSAGVGIGAAPALTALAPNTLEQGDKATVTVSGTRLDGLTEVAFDSAGIETAVQSGNSVSANISLSVPVDAPPGIVTLRGLTDAGKVEFPAALTIEAMKAPVVNSMTPKAVNRGVETSILMTGTSLGAAHVTAATPGLNIVGESPAKTVLSFRLGVDANTPAGTYQLNVSNPVGSQLVSVEVISEDQSEQPGFYMIPPVAVLATDNTFQRLILRVKQTAPVDRVFSVAMSNPAIATVSAAEVVLPAGAYETAILAKGLAAGGTALIVSGGGMVIPLEIPVEVVSGVLAPQFVVTRPVGVFWGPSYFSSGAYASASVGVVRGSRFSASPFTMALPVTVYMGSRWWAGNGTWVSPTVGIVRTPD
jgi:hypothetical protein